MFLACSISSLLERPSGTISQGLGFLTLLLYAILVVFLSISILCQGRELNPLSTALIADSCRRYRGTAQVEEHVTCLDLDKCHVEDEATKAIK